MGMTTYLKSGLAGTVTNMLLLASPKEQLTVSPGTFASTSRR
jgi:hypothetical protein